MLDLRPAVPVFQNHRDELRKLDADVGMESATVWGKIVMTAIADYLAALDQQEALHEQRPRLTTGTPEWDAHTRKVCREMHQNMKALEAQYGPFSEQ